MRRLAVCFLASFLALGATAAVAAWAPGGTGSGTSTARSIGVPTSVTASALGFSSIQVSWSAPGGGSVTPAQYVVKRTAPSTATVCTVAPPTTTCTDSGLTQSTSYSYTVESTIGTNWTSGPSATASATTSGVGAFLVSTVAGNKTAGTAFTVTLTATTNGVTTDTSYTGVKAITFSGPGTAASGTAPLYPANVTFAAGVGTASITLYLAEAPTLNASDGTRSGTKALTVVAGAAASLGYTNSNKSCASGTVAVGNKGSFTSFVTAYDAWLNPVTGARPVTVAKDQGGALAPTSLNILAGASETSASTTFTLPAGNPPDTTVAAASAGLVSANCVVTRS